MSELDSTSIKKFKFTFYLAWLLFLLIIFSILIYIGWKIKQAETTPRLVITPVTYIQLKNWTTTDNTPAFIAFKNSCKRIQNANNSDIGTISIPLQLSDMQSICSAAEKVNPINAVTTRDFFQQWFSPAIIANHRDPYGLFTGYYLPTLAGSLTKQGKYQIPIYAQPNDLLMVNLGLFDKNLQGYSVAGKISHGNLYPYNICREQIDAGALQKTAKVLVWANSKVDAFFMEIQGSGLVTLTNGKNILLGYAARNNCPYTAIGKILIANGEIPAQQISMTSIRAWLASHPEQANKIMQQNAAYIFFKVLKKSSPLGAEHVPLTPAYSLAVDNHFIPFGIPLWLETKIPQSTAPDKRINFNQLLIAQDTGGAIRGPVRGDVYWGPGTDAAIIAGNMKGRGRYYALLPRTLIKRLQK